jgi:hypothetical protein
MLTWNFATSIWNDIFHGSIYQRVSFTIAPMEEQRTSHRAMPRKPTALAIFWDCLFKKKTADFLSLTADAGNILDRILGQFTLKYEGEGIGYETVFCQGWHEIRKADALIKHSKRVQAEEDEKRVDAVMMRCLELMKGLPWKSN